MKKTKMIVFLFLSMNLLNAQNPLIKKWDYRFGGTDGELLYNLQQTADHGFILGGSSSSGISGNKTQAHWGGNDFWIVKTNASGALQWEKNFGGLGADDLFSIQQTTDGGYILGGPTDSDSSGDMTHHSKGLTDYWAVKTNSLGNKIWDKTIGGTGNDFLYSLQQTTDGGYLLGGYSNSGISGNKTQNTKGGNDYWIVKTDSLGTVQWDKDFGGTGEDFLSSVRQTADGGYILGGFSNTGINGDKSQATQGGVNDFDYWIIKTNSLGVKQWDKDFGGTSIEFLFSLKQTADHGYILAGNSSSGISGDKTESKWGLTDFWIVKTDSLGIKKWDKDFGGTGAEDDMGVVSQTADGGFLIPGTSYSPISGNKSESNLGAEQVWVIKTNALGILQWDKTLRTNTTFHDETGIAIQTNDGCFVMATGTSGGIAGDKTQVNWDISNATKDFWMIKFCDSILTGLSEESIPSIQLMVNPNPFSGEILVTVKGENAHLLKIIIKTMLGQNIFNREEINLNNNYSKTIDLSFLSKGIYLLDVIVDGKQIVKKIIRE